MPNLRSFLVFIPVLVLNLAPAPSFAQSLLLRPASTTPLEQLTGETFQIDSNGFYFYDFTASRTMSKYGLLGCDLGYPVVYADKILFLYGDTLSTFTNSSGQFVLTAGSGGDDNISFIPNVDLSQCHYIPDVDAQLAQGIAHPQPGYGACPVLQTYENPNHALTDHVFQTTTISGLTSSEGVGPDETPSGAFDYNGYLYMFYIVQVQRPPNPPHFALESDPRQVRSTQRQLRPHQPAHLSQALSSLRSRRHLRSRQPSARSRQRRQVYVRLRRRHRPRHPRRQRASPRTSSRAPVRSAGRLRLRRVLVLQPQQSLSRRLRHSRHRVRRCELVLLCRQQRFESMDLR